MNMSIMTRMNELEEENLRLKKMYAESKIDATSCYQQVILIFEGDRIVVF